MNVEREHTIIELVHRRIGPSEDNGHCNRLFVVLVRSLGTHVAASPVVNATYPSLRNSIKINSLVGTRVLLSVTDNPTGEGGGKKLRTKKKKGRKREGGKEMKEREANSMKENSRDKG